MKNKKMIKRVLLLGLSLLLLCATLISCGGSTADYKWVAEDGEESCVNYFSRILLLNADARQRFVAASRGWDMSAEGFKDENLQIGQLGSDDVVAAALAIALNQKEK